MKKILFLGSVACAIIISSCAKDDYTQFDTSDRNALAEASSVNYAVEIKGLPPAPSTDAGSPVMTGPDEVLNVTIFGTNSFFLRPKVASPSFKGYIVQIVGANSYFRTNYPMAMEGDEAVYPFMEVQFPKDLEEDTFSIRYAAYDSSNRVSQYRTILVQALVKSSLTETAPLFGDWKTAGVMDVEPDTLWGKYICNNGKLTPCKNNNGCLAIPFYINRVHSEISFSSLGIYTDNQNSRSKSIDLERSTCDNLAFTTSSGNAIPIRAEYGYHRQKGLLFIRPMENAYSFTSVYRVINLSHDSLIISDQQGRILRYGR